MSQRTSRICAHKNCFCALRQDNRPAHNNAHNPFRGVRLCAACCAGEIPEGAAMSRRRPPARPAGSTAATKAKGAARAAESRQRAATTRVERLP